MTKKGKFSEGLLDEGAIFKGLKIKPGQTILDAGCGTGYMAKKFSKVVGKTGKVYALDHDEHFITLLQGEVTGTNIEAMIGDICSTTSLQECSIDLVYLSTVFHIFSPVQIVRFVQEVARILRPDGTLAIMNIRKEDTLFGPPVEMRSSPEELREKNLACSNKMCCSQWALLYAAV